LDLIANKREYLKEKDIEKRIAERSSTLSRLNAQQARHKEMMFEQKNPSLNVKVAYLKKSSELAEAIVKE
jgi:hypothetical protein